MILDKVTKVLRKEYRCVVTNSFELDLLHNLLLVFVFDSFRDK